MTLIDPNAPLGERFHAAVAGFRSVNTLRRLIACIAGGLVLSLMVGTQEGNTQTVDGSSFRAGLLSDYRYLIFGAIGLVLFVVVTLWPVIAPLVRSPGTVGVAVGFLLVLVALLLLKWYDGAANIPGHSNDGSSTGKFGKIADVVGDTPSLGFPSSFFFGFGGYLLWLLCLVLGIVAVATRIRLLGWVLTVLGLFAAFCCFYGHDQFVDLAQSFGYGHDHSLGVWMALVGFLVTAGAGVVIALSRAEDAHPREFVDRVLDWRPGFAVLVVAALLALVSLINASWFAPLGSDLDFRAVSDVSGNAGLDPLSEAWFGYLCLIVCGVGIAGGLVAAYLRVRLAGIGVALIGLFGLVVNFVAMHDLSSAGFRQQPSFGKTWLNLGTGGWLLCIVFSGVATAGALIFLRRPADEVDPDAQRLHRAAGQAARSPLARLLIPVAITVALFYPPTLTGEWQNTLVTQIGPYLLLAVGLNVVIGWAGLLDLGYIAFYAVGAYTTAYFTGSLPVKPPTWLQFFHSPLWAIPFAVIAALIAGVLLGAPTLRLRGDYLAIVTLGFGEIIQVIATNNPGGFTGGARGPNVPNPVFDIGFLHIHFGQDNLPYWYLLLLMLVVIMILFFRLENSRLGRAWAAIREDEIAAQASGVNTTRVKLLAFAIGASTSGLAGVFFATQVGYFDPSLFTLQNSILIVAYVVFGGMGSLPGALAGAAVLTWLPQFLKTQVPQEDQIMWVGALILLMMIFRPQGLIPARRRAAELHGMDSPSSAEVRAVPAGEGM